MCGRKLGLGLWWFVVAGPGPTTLTKSDPVDHGTGWRICKRDEHGTVHIAIQQQIIALVSAPLLLQLHAVKVDPVRYRVLARPLSHCAEGDQVDNLSLVEVHLARMCRKITGQRQTVAGLT